MGETPIDAAPPERPEGARRWWTWAAPLVAWGLIGAERVGIVPETSPAFVAVAALASCAMVFAAVSHAETVAARVGPTAGVVILGLAVTTIEVSLIASMMFGIPADATTVARDTVFAGVMVVVNGVGGLSLLIGGLRHHEQRFQLQGTASALGVLGTLAIVTMILPDYTVSEPLPTFSPVQLGFVAVSSLVLIGFFIFAQTIGYREHFADAEAPATGSAPVSWPTALLALAMLVATLVATVLLADGLAPAVRAASRASGCRRSAWRWWSPPSCSCPGHLGGARRLGRPHPDEPQPGARLGDPEHRADHSGDRAPVAGARRADHPRARARARGAAGADAVHLDADAVDGADDGASGRRASRHLRGVPGDRGGALSHVPHVIKGLPCRSLRQGGLWTTFGGPAPGRIGATTRRSRT
jgi:hypothetical protein